MRQKSLSFFFTLCFLIVCPLVFAGGLYNPTSGGGGALGPDSVGTDEIDDDANSPTAGDLVIIETGAASFDYLTPHAGTDLTADLEEEAHASEHAENAADELLVENLGTACADGEIPKANASGGLDCGTDATGAGGSAIVLDLADDDVDESSDLIEIATTGDTNSVFTEPSADKLLIDVGQNWPTADSANAVAADSVALGTDTTGNYAAGDSEAGNALSGDSATAFFSAGTIEHERGGLEADISVYNGLIRINGGATSNVTNLTGLNTALGSSIADGAHTTDTGPSPDCSGTTTYQDGEGNCDTLNAGTDITADLEEETHASEHQENGADELLGETLGTACTDGQILKANASGGLDCGTDATGAGGSAIVLDLADDDVDESSDLTEIAITNDTNSIFTEPSADKLLINASNNWPTADTADALSANGSNCSAGSAPLGVDAAGAAESCTDYEEDLSNSAGLLAALSDETGSGLAVFGTSPTIATPILTGKIDRNNVSVDDDDCTGEQGLYWYDTTDNAFEFCNANSGAPATLGGGSSGATFALFGSTNANINSDQYLPFAGDISWTTTEAHAQTVVPAITCTDIRCRVATAPGAGETWNIYLRDDGVNTSLVCTISNTNTTGTGTTDATLAAGSLANFFWDEVSASALTGGASVVAKCQFD